MVHTVDHCIPSTRASKGVSACIMKEVEVGQTLNTDESWATEESRSFWTHYKVHADQVKARDNAKFSEICGYGESGLMSPYTDFFSRTPHQSYTLHLFSLLIFC